MSKISFSNAEHYEWGDACDGWHLLKQDNLSIIHEKMPPHTAEVRHYHVFSSQFFFMLTGEAVIEKDGEECRLYSHQGIEIPAGTTHQIRNESDEPIEFLVTSQPPAHGDRVVVKKSEKYQSCNPLEQLLQKGFLFELFCKRLFSKRLLFLNRFCEAFIDKLVGAQGARLLREERDR